MANYERDRNERVFDGGDDEDDGEGSHLPVVIIIAILVLAAFGGVVWLAYNQGVARGRGEPRVAVVADTAHLRGDSAGIKVYQQPAAGEEDESVAKPAAKPAPVVDAPSQPAPSSPQAVAVTKQANSAEAVHVASSAVAQPASREASVKPVTITPAANTSTKPTQVLPQQATSQPSSAAPATSSVATHPPAQLGLSRPSTASPLPAQPVTPPAKPAATVSAPAVHQSKVSAGGYLLQVGAYKSENDALSAWKTYQSKHAALLSGFGPDVQKVDLGDKGTWYRLRIASFSDKDAAVALCDRLKAQNANCFLAH